MATYFENYADNGTLTIDDVRKNFSLEKVIKLSDCTYIGSGQSYVSYIDAYSMVETNPRAIIAIRPVDALTDNDANIYAGAGTGNTTQFFAFADIVYENTRYIFINKSSQTVYDASKVLIYIFTEGVKSNDKFGLEVFDEKGIRLFHSNDYQLKVLDYAVVNDTATKTGSDLNNHQKYSYDTKGKKVAVCFSSLMSTFALQIYGMFQVALIVYHAMAWWKRNGTIGFYRDAIVDSYVYDQASYYKFITFQNTRFSSQLLLIDVSHIPEPK